MKLWNEITKGKSAEKARTQKGKTLRNVIFKEQKKKENKEVRVSQEERMKNSITQAEGKASGGWIKISSASDMQKRMRFKKKLLLYWWQRRV